MLSLLHVRFCLKSDSTTTKRTFHIVFRFFISLASTDHSFDLLEVKNGFSDFLSVNFIFVVVIRIILLMHLEMHLLYDNLAEVVL